jgi:DNA-binding MarR family transcriptional regulator
VIEKQRFPEESADVEPVRLQLVSGAPADRPRGRVAPKQVGFTMRFNEAIPFLMHGIVANSVAKATQEFGAMGLSIAEARVLVGVLQNPGIRVGHLSDLTCIAQSTLSHLLRRLGRQGLLHRKRVDHDNRSVIVELTAAGRQEAQACRRLAELQEQMIVANIEPARIAEFRALLAEIYHRLVPASIRVESAAAAISPTQRSRRRAVKS